MPVTSWHGTAYTSGHVSKYDNWKFMDFTVVWHITM